MTIGNNVESKDQYHEGQGLKQDKGSILLVQRFSVHDGPGIRTTVFMKGCPLRCWWCQNPDSLNPNPELMFRISRCQTCGKCADSCVVNAITFDGESINIQRTKCNRCFECVLVCSTGALTKVGEYMSVEEVVMEIEKDEIFYRKSNGGVTVSGGEPLSQEVFVTSLLQVCKQKGYQTALDTSGYAPWPVFKKTLEYVDLVLYDIKHMNPKLHKEATGQSNELILNNIRKIPRDKRVWLRIPLVPGFNDTKENVEKVGELGKEIGVERVSILPFHKLGEGKYRQLDKQYYGWEVKAPDRVHVREVKKILKRFGLKVTIGE